MPGNNIYYIEGIHIIWWILWLGALIWLFLSRISIAKLKLGNELPLEILQRRYVLGEIEKDEYLEKLELLTD